jgi:hypothetical protein
VITAPTTLQVPWRQEPESLQLAVAVGQSLRRQRQARYFSGSGW